MTSTAHLARPRAVEVGGGFAGIDAAWALEHSDTDVNLVVRRSFHTFGTAAELVDRLTTKTTAFPVAGVAGARATRPAIPTVVDIVRLSDIPGYDNNKLIAQPLIEGSQSNVRVIKLSPGQALPAHRHGLSDLMLFAVEGEGVLETENGTIAFAAGSLACYRGDEELRVSNEGRVGLTLLAFLAPPFPPRSET